MSTVAHIPRRHVRGGRPAGMSGLLASLFAIAATTLALAGIFAVVGGAPADLPVSLPRLVE